jgi:hypothetical protein
MIEALECRTLLAVNLHFSGGTQGITPYANVRVSVDPAFVQSEMSVAVNPVNPLNVVAFSHRIGSGAMHLFRSFDGGSTWTPLVINNAVDGFNSNFRFDPTVTFDDAGRLYIGYGVDPVGGTRNLLVGRSDNGGVSFSSFSSVRVDPSLDKWIMTAGRDPLNPNQQNVYIVYRIGTGAVVSNRVATSFNLGLTWAVDTLIPDDAQAGSDFASFGCPAVGPGGQLYVVWDDFDGAPAFSTIKFARSFDAGLTFDPDVLIVNTPITRNNPNGFPNNLRYHISAQPDRGVLAVPSVAVDRSGGPLHGTIYIAYTDRGFSPNTDDTDVYVTSSFNGGVTWTTPQLVHSPSAGSQFLPWMSCDPRSGAVAVAFYDTRHDPTNRTARVWVAASLNGGVTWNEAELATASSDQSLANPARYPGNYLEYIGVAVMDGTIHAVWADNRNSPGDLEVYTAKASFDSPFDSNELRITGSTPLSNDDILIRQSSADFRFVEVYVQGELKYAGMEGSMDHVRVEAGVGFDTVTIQSIPQIHPIRIQLLDGPDPDVYRVEQSSFAWPVDLFGSSGEDVLSVSDPNGVGTRVEVATPTFLREVSVGTNAQVGLLPMLAQFMYTRRVAVAPGGLLDLRDNDLIVDYSGISPYSQVLNDIRNARDPVGGWSGFGITSSVARVNPLRTTGLGILESADYIAANGTNVFAGVAVDPTSVLVKYTYNGDTELNGVVDFDDYARIDAAFLAGGTGVWFDGDSDHNGLIDFDDYLLIDAAFLLQGPPL